MLTRIDETIYPPCFEKTLTIEVNGVYHYARNSEDILGRDILKRKALTKLGYHPHSFTVPYYEWAILENSKRKSYIQQLIVNALN